MSDRPSPDYQDGFNTANERADERIRGLEAENARLRSLVESWKATAEAEAEIGNERAAENTQLRKANEALSAMLKPVE